jgi:thioredoxin reductase
MNEHSELSGRCDSELVDTVIVGGGIGGLSAGLFIPPAGRSTIVYDVGRSRILAVERIHEFIGFDGLSPKSVSMSARAGQASLRLEARAIHRMGSFLPQEC